MSICVCTKKDYFLKADFILSDVPAVNGIKLSIIKTETTTAAVASATSEVIEFVDFAISEAKITAKLLKVSANTCYEEIIKRN